MLSQASGPRKESAPLRVATSDLDFGPGVAARRDSLSLRDRSSKPGTPGIARTRVDIRSGPNGWRLRDRILTRRPRRSPCRRLARRVGRDPSVPYRPLEDRSVRSTPRLKTGAQDLGSSAAWFIDPLRVLRVLREKLNSEGCPPRLRPPRRSPDLRGGGRATRPAERTRSHPRSAAWARTKGSSRNERGAPSWGAPRV